MEVIKDIDGQEVSRTAFEAHEYMIHVHQRVQGYSLSNYMPKNEARASIVRWAFDCVEDQHSAVAEQKAATEKDTRKHYPQANFAFAANSWNWPALPICSQKLVKQDMFDPDDTYFARGAHMPLMVFIGSKGQIRRKPESRAKRTAKQGLRGITPEYIAAHKRGEKGEGRGRGRGSGRGRGATSWQWKAMPGNDSGGRSSSSNQAANDPSRTASQDERGWNTSTWSNINGVANNKVYHCIETHGRGANPSFRTHVSESNSFSSSFRSGRYSFCCDFYFIRATDRSGDKFKHINTNKFLPRTQKNILRRQARTKQTLSTKSTHGA